MPAGASRAVPGPGKPGPTPVSEDHVAISASPIGRRPPTRPAGMKRNLFTALRFLLPLGRTKAPDDPAAAAGMIPWIVPTGLAIGLLWAGSFRLGWRVFGETARLRVIPSLIVVLIECLFTGAVLVLGVARTSHVLTGRSPLRAENDPLGPLSPVATLVLCLTLLCEYTLILSIPAMPGWWPPPNDWRHTFNFMYPSPVYRPLLLAPIWGRWGILLAATLGRSAHNADAQTVGLKDRKSVV